MEGISSELVSSAVVVDSQSLIGSANFINHSAGQCARQPDVHRLLTGRDDRCQARRRDLSDPRSLSSVKRYRPLRYDDR